MRRERRVSGAIVVQSYLQAARYTHEDRTLLEYVAQHILTALDRRQAREQLERRVDERTRELQQANMVLQAEIIERQRAEKLQRALYSIKSEEHTSELQSLMRISYAVFCLKNKKTKNNNNS